ncbi:DUF7312 domain-containing protein [Halovenus halobia]|uniref:DUF7312 domain-containing protein n=1 Tax=Halovenus halobia TaxID=3396622 RepID=UPI003F54846F
MAAPSDDDEEWKISVDDVGPPAHEDHEEATDEQTGGNIAGTLAHNQPLEPGDVDLENAVFVVLGVLLVVLLIAGAILGI